MAQQCVQVDQFSFEMLPDSSILLTRAMRTPQISVQVYVDDVIEELTACTCPDYVHRNAFYKYMAAVENVITDRKLDIFISKDSKRILNQRSATVTASVLEYQLLSVDNYTSVRPACCSGTHGRR